MTKIDTAMVLAAGLGTRMRPLTLNRPKTLIEVGGKALLDHSLDRFALAGVRKTVVNIHYLAEQIELHLANRKHPEILISDERDKLLETGGGLQAALPLLPQNPVFCTNTDAVFLDGKTTEACEVLKDRWDANHMDALLLLAPITNTSGYNGSGDFDLYDNGEISFRRADTSSFVFTGLQIISTDLIKNGPGGAYSTKILWDMAAKRRRLYGVVYDGFWMHVGDPNGLREADKILLDRNVG